MNDAVARNNGWSWVDAGKNIDNPEAAKCIPEWVDSMYADMYMPRHECKSPSRRLDVPMLIDTAAEPDAFTLAVSDVYLEAQALLLKKHQDYGPKNISASPGGPLNGLRVRMWDKMARLNHLLDSGAEPANESLRDSFVDLLNYCAIALLVQDGKWPE
jgi:hypothetical protein